MYQRKDGDKVITEHKTKMPTDAELHTRKQQQIAEQQKRRADFMKSREKKPAAPAPVKPVTTKPAVSE